MTGARLQHVPALDGLRGLAVVGVLAFHLGHLEGGYLGVDLFFVLSGFLITSLLLVERETTGHIALGAFWARRARRLLPALFLLLAAVAVYAATDPVGVAMGALRGDALATLGYVANWHSIGAEVGYWDLFAAPSLLAHTWSLAIEEQLYVVWPLIVFVVLRFGRRALLGTSIALGAASATAMIVLHGAGDETSRVYFGTDTRAAAVLAGAALAAWGGQRLRGAPIIGTLAAIGLGGAWFTVSGTSNGLYEGGFLLCSVAGALVIAGALQPGPLTTVLSARPLRHLGAISYGVYLWHWPVFVVLDSASDLGGAPLLVTKLLVTLVISEVSYRVLELPIRRGSLPGWRIRVLGPAAAAAALVAVVAGTAAPAPASETPAAAPPPIPVSLPETVAGTTRVLVVGDSGAHFIGAGMENINDPDRVLVRNAGTVGCGIANEGGRLKLDDGGYFVDAEWCHEWPERWRAELEAFEPDVALLTIAWPGLGDRLVEGEWRHPCDPVYDEYYASEVRRALVVLAGTGARVAITDSPYLWLPVTQDDAAARVDCLNVIYHREAEAAGAQLIGLGAWTCRDPQHCVEEIDGEVLRYDGIHFRDAGADIAAEWVLSQIEQQHDAEGGEDDS